MLDSISTRVRSRDWRVTLLRTALGAVAVVLVTLCGAARPQAAELTPSQKAEMKSLYERATRAYDVGKYAEAIEEYQKAYEIGGDPPMLYNIAQAYRLNDQPGEAVRFYRRYLQRAPQARNREDVERKIAELEKQIEERRKQQAAVTPPPAPAPTPSSTPAPAPIVGPPAPVAAAPTTGTEGTVGEVTQTPAAPEEGMSSTRKIVGLSVIGGGVAVGVVAGIFAFIAKGKADDVTTASQKGEVFNPDVQTAGKNASTTAIVCGAVAGAAAVTGAIILFTGGSSSSDSGSEAPVSTARARVTPWLGAGLVGAGADFRF
jgi:hypothetical protein